MTPNPMEVQLEQVRQRMADALAETVLPRMVGDCRRLVGTGKMLRARLILRLASAQDLPAPISIAAAAAVELIHAASLLHDDVIDGGVLRRNLPAFWKERGATGAILVGDLMLFKALDLLVRTEAPRLLADLVRYTGEICNAEAEQELLSGSGPATPDRCMDMNRRKTGALFAFAAGVGGGDDPVRDAALQRAGYALGTAYQLADDFLDVAGDKATAGKTLGRDRDRQIQTAADLFPNGMADAQAARRALQSEALATLEAWPTLQGAVREYRELDFNPALNQWLVGGAFVNAC